jgi:hypothetical protein
MSDRLTPQRETEIRERAEVVESPALPGGSWLASERNEKSVLPPEMAHVVENVVHTKHSLMRSSVGVFGDAAHAEFVAHAPEDIDALLAELAAVRAERDEARAELAKFGQEPTVVEELAYLSRCLDAVYDVCDEAKRQARRWEAPLPVAAWVATVEQAADGQRPDNPKDRRRRLYIDGKGNAWISLSHDKDIRYIGRLAGAMPGDDTEDSVREATGSLREIGRCW